MRTIAFVGPSGTGKSYRATMIAGQYGADGIIDDGILISHGKLIAGSSAKKEPTRLASVRHALFTDDSHANAVKSAIKKSNIQCLMILGTSDGMVNKIANRLEVGKIEQIIRIEDVATPQEMDMARDLRLNQGQHVIPLPTFEIKQDFSGYFLHPLQIFRRNKDKKDDTADNDKSIVRPTFSYMGNYTISDNTLIAMAKHETEKINGVHVSGIIIRKTNHGLHLDINLTLAYGIKIYDKCRLVQRAIKKSIEEYTSINVRRVHITVRSLKF